MELYLVEVRRQSAERTLRLTFSDGHSADYGYDYLRGWCPCAVCQGHESHAARFQPPAKPVTAGTIEPVGNYAIAIVFSDGHSSGIYHFDFLRQICPCDECVARRQSTGSTRE